MTVQEHLRDVPLRQSGSGTHRVLLTGMGFIVLLLVCAGMASVPDADSAPAQVRDFYLQHNRVVLGEQFLGLAAAGCFAVFARVMGPTTESTPARLRSDVAGTARPLPRSARRFP